MTTLSGADRHLFPTVAEDIASEADSLTEEMVDAVGRLARRAHEEGMDPNSVVHGDVLQEWLTENDLWVEIPEPPDAARFDAVESEMQRLREHGQHRDGTFARALAEYSRLDPAELRAAYVANMREYAVLAWKCRTLTTAYAGHLQCGNLSGLPGISFHRAVSLFDLKATA